MYFFSGFILQYLVKGMLDCLKCIFLIKTIDINMPVNSFSFEIERININVTYSVAMAMVSTHLVSKHVSKETAYIMRVLLKF